MYHLWESNPGALTSFRERRTQEALRWEPSVWRKCCSGVFDSLPAGEELIQSRIRWFLDFWLTQTLSEDLSKEPHRWGERIRVRLKNKTKLNAVYEDKSLKQASMLIWIHSQVNPNVISWQQEHDSIQSQEVNQTHWGWVKDCWVSAVNHNFILSLAFLQQILVLLENKQKNVWLHSVDWCIFNTV